MMNDRNPGKLGMPDRADIGTPDLGPFRCFGRGQRASGPFLE